MFFVPSFLATPRKHAHAGRLADKRALEGARLPARHDYQQKVSELTEGGSFKHLSAELSSPFEVVALQKTSIFPRRSSKLNRVSIFTESKTKSEINALSGAQQILQEQVHLHRTLHFVLKHPSTTATSQGRQMR